MPIRKEPPTPRSAAALSRHAGSSSSSSSALAPLIPFKAGQTSLRHQAILTEDEYTSALSAIIKRDFFPTLDRVTAENEYLAAVESDDPMPIKKALRKLLNIDQGNASGGRQGRIKRRAEYMCPSTLRGVKKARGEWDDTPIASASRGRRVFNPTFTPAESTPGTVAGEDEEEEEVEDELGSGITPDPNLSLADFQARYTSEDNASFSQLLDRDNQVRKRKHAHIFAREGASASRRRRVIQAEQADAAQGKRRAIEANPDHPALLEHEEFRLLIEDGKGKERSKEVARDPMDDLVLVPEPRLDDRPAPNGLNGWKYTARNALMFGPDANTSTLHARRSTTRSSTCSSYQTAPEEQPRTNFTALRLPEHSDPIDVDGSEAGWSPSSSRIDAAIRRGRAGSTASFSSSTDETPKVNGYGFVTPYATPQHSHTTQVAADEADDMHLKIYNAIKAKRRNNKLPDLTDGAASGMREFELPGLDRREEVAQRMVANASPRTVAGGTTPYGVQRYTGLAGLRSRGFARRRGTELTPAARSLLDRSTRGSLTPASVASGTPVAQSSQRGTVGSRGWTPTPQHTSGHR